MRFREDLWTVSLFSCLQSRRAAWEFCLASRLMALVLSIHGPRPSSCLPVLWIFSFAILLITSITQRIPFCLTESRSPPSPPNLYTPESPDLSSRVLSWFPYLRILCRARRLILRLSSNLDLNPGAGWNLPRSGIWLHSNYSLTQSMRRDLLDRHRTQQNVTWLLSLWSNSMRRIKILLNLNTHAIFHSRSPPPQPHILKPWRMRRAPAALNFNLSLL